MSVAKSALATGGFGGTNGVIAATAITNTSATLNTLTVGASDTTAIIFITYNAAATTSGWTVKLGSATASLIASSSLGETTGGNVSIIAFEVKNPPSGAQALTGFNSGFGASVPAYESIITFIGSDTVNPSVAFGNATGTAATTATTNASGSSIPSTDMVAAWFSDFSGGFGTVVGSYGTTGGTSLTFVDQDGAVANNAGQTYCTGNNATVTMTATQGGSDGYCALGIWVAVPAAAVLGSSGYNSQNGILVPNRGPQRRLQALQAFPAIGSSVSLSTISTTQFTAAFGTPTGKLPLIGKATVDAMSQAQAAGKAAMSAQAATKAKSSIGTPSLKATLLATVSTMAKAFALPKGVVGLAARAATQVKALLSSGKDWTHIQGTNTGTGSGLTNSLAFTNPVGVGNVVRGAVLLNSGSFITNVTDDKGNAYRVTVSGDDGVPTLYTALFRSLHLVTNNPQTITVTCSPSSSNFWIILDEFSPPSGTTDISLDGGQVAVNTTGASIANFRTTKPDTLVYSASFSTGVSTTGGAFNPGNGSGTQRCSEWAIQATASDSVNASYATQTGTTWMAVDAIAPVAQNTWEPIQRQMQRTGSGTSGSVTLPNPVTAGNMVVGSIAVGTPTGPTLASGLTSLADDKGNNYQLISGTLGNLTSTGDRQIFWSGGLLNNGPQTITATFNASEAIIFFLVAEFAPPPGTNAVAIDGPGVNNTASPGVTTTTTPNTTTVNNNDLAYSFSDTNGGNTTAANSFSALNGESLTWEDGWQIWPTARTANASWTHNSGSSNASLVVFSATLALTALVSAKLKAIANFAGAVPLQILSRVQVKTTDQPSGKASLISKATTQATSRLGTPSLKAAMSAVGAAMVKAFASSTGKVGLAAKAKATVRSLAAFGSSGFVSLVARASAMVGAMGLLTGNTSLFLQGFATTAVKFTASPAGKVGLAAKTATLTMARAAIGFGGFLSLISRATIATRAALGTPSLKAALAARGEAMGSASAAPAPTVGLATRTATQARVKAGAAYTAVLSAIAKASTATRLTNPTGKLALAARTAMQTKAIRGFLAGFNIPISLVANASLSVKAVAKPVLSFLPVAERTIAVAFHNTIKVATNTIIQVAKRVRTLNAKW